MSDMTTTPISATNSGTITTGEMHKASSVDGPASSMREEWREFAAFLKRPSLDVSTKSKGAWTVLPRIYALDMLAMALLIGLASALIAAGVYIPETALAGMEFTWEIVALVVIGAPVMEEIAFRGWLSGRPGPVFGLLALAAGAIGFALTHSAMPALGALLAIGGMVGAGAFLFTLRKKGAMGWFARGFPALFWFSTLAFALVHLANFEEGSLAVLLPLVLPQFILGSMLGYVRVRFGLWSSIALHAAHNGTALSIAALAGQIG